MVRILALAGILALTLARCDCDDEPGPTGPTPIVPNDTSNTSIDSTLLGTWHRYNASGTLIQQDFARITDDSIVVMGLPTLTGVVDSSPLVARALIARNGQIYYHRACTGCPDEYFYDYAMSAPTLYLVSDTSSAATTPGAGTAGVMILKRSIDTIMDVDIITDSLIGTWDRYDSTGTTHLESNFLVVSASAIVYRTVVTFQGFIDTVGTTGRTLVAQNGQIWYDYHSTENDDRYIYDYAVFNNGLSMYFADETQPTYANPGPSSEFTVRYLKKRQ